MDVNEIIESYRNADEEGRCVLFLQYRDLRAVFTEIDAGGDAVAVALAPPRDERGTRRLSFEEARM